MRRWKIDVEYFIISAVVSLLPTVAIIFMVKTMQPALIDIDAGTAVFIYIGVFTANFLIEARRKRFDNDHKR